MVRDLVKVIRRNLLKRQVKRLKARSERLWKRADRVYYRAEYLEKVRDSL